MFIASIRFALVVLVYAFTVAQAQTYKYFRLGNPSDVQTKAKFGRLDILVNNAAVMQRTFLHEVTSENIDMHFNVNVKG